MVKQELPLCTMLIKDRTFHGFSATGTGRALAGAPYSIRAESATSDFAQRRYVAALRPRFKEMFNTLA
jgi:hypothetical protein